MPTPLVTAYTLGGLPYYSAVTDVADIRDFSGVDPKGFNDSTSAVKAAHLSGAPVYYPPGTYAVSSGITIPSGGILGAGQTNTIFLVTDTANADVFTYTGNGFDSFQDFQMRLATTKTGGYGLVFRPTAGEVANTRFERLVFTGLPNGLNFVAASQWSLHASNFLNCTGDCVTINNTNNNDSGDSVISNTIFNNSTSTTANAVHQIESGGLKIVGTKFNNGGVHVLLDVGTGSTSDLVLVGNSLENAHFSAVQLQRQGGSAAIFQNVVLVGNQILVSSTSGNSTGIYTNNGSNFLDGLVISGNVIRVNDSGTPAAISVDYVNNYLIGDNVLIGNGGAGSVGILRGTHNGAGSLGTNQIAGFGTSII